MNEGTNEYIPVLVVLCKIDLAGAILDTSIWAEGDIEDYVLQKEDDC